MAEELLLPSSPPSELATVLHPHRDILLAANFFVLQTAQVGVDGAGPWWCGVDVGIL
jgi:hypothetical protein